MKRLPYTLVLVGKCSPEHTDYLKKVEDEAGDNVRVIGAIRNDDPMLASCYRAAKLFVLPSFSEVMPLTINEAVLAGCRIVVSNRVPVSESIVPHSERFRPDDIEAIARIIDHKMQDRGANREASQAVAAMPTWTICRWRARSPWPRCSRCRST